MDIDDPNDFSLDVFMTWKVDALKLFLEKRGLSKEGTKAELAALCFSAARMNLPILPSSSQILSSNFDSYSKLLKITDELTIPDPFKLNSGWSSEKDALRSWPKVDITDITKFFVRHCPDVTSDHFLSDYKLGKAYEYFSNKWLKEIFYHQLNVNDKQFCLLRANCTPSQRVSHTDHKVWVCTERTGRIMSAYCSCTAGLGQTCNHIAGILYRLEDANSKGYVQKELACTDLPCGWTVPPEKITYGPKLISEMVVKKSKYKKSEKARPLVSLEKRRYTPLTGHIDDPLKSLGDALANILPNACLFKGMRSKAESQGNNNTCTTSVKDQQGLPVKKKVMTHEINNVNSQRENAATLQDQIGLPVKEKDMTHEINHRENAATSQDQIDPSVVKTLERKLSLVSHAQQYARGQEADFLDALPEFDPEEIKMVERLTRNQSKCELWHEARKGRITASKFYAVHTKTRTIKADESKDPKTLPLLRILMGETGFTDDNCPKAIKHGRTMEPVAKQKYILQNSTHHDNFSATECGLILNNKFPYLGASPDMMISCSCCGNGVLEIKCPMVSTKTTPNKYQNNKCCECNPSMCNCGKFNFSCLENSTGKFMLKKNHAYYGQIQGQMAVTGYSYCDFYIYSPVATHQERIQFDSDYWTDILENLKFFFCKYMVPFLLSNKTDANRIEEPMDVDIATESTDDASMGNVFFCPICNERVKEQENILSFGDRSICCDVCDTWCHFKCVKITKSSLKSLKTWKCPSCV